ncbi:(2Fe-2S)-binding protein [Paracoccus sp. S4493]|uniref:Rieske (2Fe-2S) protein n=1 Tax=unclassified Paracoccus (in: a-proteobacteria) TaxID=2688777 RepID=UPI0005DEF88D|nr:MULTISPECIES: Rieske 2Fe-2S domain-containing protein [unclassified Paracoccus (in: a-proteobacteria)]KIX18936.1 (2Fe-2S)-binding protein [Paracoccus sp. 228]KJZ32484.1 (2Fe-2S)-binding protein [Paracoccus sp. S4493]TYP60639.1 nitrite reductase/ring-hydroxylating ferredoxin subunit [Stutzerimonas stutzeri]
MIMAWTDYSSAPAPGTRVCAATGITGVHPLTVTTDRGSFPMIVLRDGDVLRAYVNACPHQYLPLDYRGDTLLSADGLRLLCTAHGASFDKSTGSVVAGAECGLDAVPIMQQGDHIVIAP